MLLEDLGDETLAAFLERAPARRGEIYRAAVIDLAGAQRALRALPDGSVVAARAFDDTLLRWELDHFREWGLDARGRALPEEERARFDAIADRLARRIAAWPRGFVHRDYQSRNLMVRDRAQCQGTFVQLRSGRRIDATGVDSDGDHWPLVVLGHPGH